MTETLNSCHDCGRLSPEEKIALQLHKKTHQHYHSEDEQCHGHAHGPGPKPPSIITAFASAIINYLLMFGLCCAYGMIMFYDPWHKQHVGLGIKMNLGTAMIVGFLLSTFSKVNVAIGGPDLNPVVFIGGFVNTMAPKIAKTCNLVYPSKSSRRLLEDVLDLVHDRNLAAKKSYPEFCIGNHLTNNAAMCECYHESLRATTIFAVAFSSACLGLTYFCLGKFKLSKYVNFVPTSIMEAFLSCIGYKVFKYALKFCDQSPRQFVPAAVVGVVMYFVKAMHIGNPAIMLPGLLLAPLVIFYIVSFTAMEGLTDARIHGYMFPEVKDVEFYKIWTDSLGKIDRIDFAAWSSTIVDLIIMLIVCTLDCMLKVSSTESKLPVKVEKDYEVQLYGYGNVLTTLCGQTVGYMQLKFNVINYGVMGNTTDRRGGLIYALLCGICFFFTVEHFNLLPRLFLGTMLFFAGAGFVAENLWGSRLHLDLAEWLQILIILAVFIMTEKLLYAVIVGAVLVGVSFIIKYAQVPCIVGRPSRGGEILSRQSYPALMEQGLKHISRHWVQVVKLKGFLFFASADGLLNVVTETLMEEKKSGIPQYARTKYIIFDCEMLDGLDASAVKALLKFNKESQATGVQIVWSGVSQERANTFKSKELVQNDSQWYEDLASALLYTDRGIIEFLYQMQGLWVLTSPLLELSHKFASAQNQFEPWADVFFHPASRLGIPWLYCDHISMKAFSTLLWYPEKTDQTLFIVYSGAVAVYDNIPFVEQSSTKEDRAKTVRAAAAEWPMPTAIHRHGAIVNRTSLSKINSKTWGVALEDGEVLCWTQRAWDKMLFERPRMAFAVLSAAMRQEQQHSEQAAREQVCFSGSKVTKSIGRHVNVGKSVPELSRHMRAITSAKALGKKGFYNTLAADEVGTLPKLPKSMQHDIDIAFRVHANADGVLEWDKVEKALMYVGIFQPMLNEQRSEKVTLDMFMSIAHHLMMQSLGREQIDEIHRMFKRFDKDNSGVLEIGEMTQVFKTEFTAEMLEEEINGIVEVWLDNGTYEVDTIDFEGIMSWFIQRHSPYWTFLCGLMELTGSTDPAQVTETVITKEMLMSRIEGLSEENAEQMIWAASYVQQAQWLSNEACSLVLDPVMLAAVVFTVHGSAPSKLPPMSDTPKTKTKRSLDDLMQDSTHVSRAASKLIMDRRAVSSGSLVFKPVTCPTSATSATIGNHTKTLEIEIEMEAKEPLPDTLRVKMHRLLEEPDSSDAANMVSTIMGVCILISVVTLVLEPLISPEESKSSQLEKDIWFTFELFFTLVFLTDYLLRLSVASALGTQTECDFIKTPSNVCDVLAILPFFVEKAVNSNSAHFRLLRVVRLIRLSRMARVAKLAKKSALFGPVAAVLTVIWGIYLKTRLADK